MIKCNEEAIECNDFPAGDSYIFKSIELHLLAAMSQRPSYGWWRLNQLASCKTSEVHIIKPSKRAANSKSDLLAALRINPVLGS